MRKKPIIIAVIFLVVLALFFGYKYIDKVLHTVETYVEKISSLGEAVLDANGLDFNQNLTLFIPLLEDTSFGTYYDEASGEIKYVGTRVKQFLPNWITESHDNTGIKVKIYPTLYSVDFSYNCFSLDIHDRFGITNQNQIFTNKTAFNKFYCVRLNITIPNYIGDVGLGATETNLYDIYIFYHDGSFKYFVSSYGTDIGYYTSRLSSYDEYKQEEEIANKLTWKYQTPIVNLDDNILQYYRYAYTNRVQDTGLYLSGAFDLFLKGE